MKTVQIVLILMLFFTSNALACRDSDIPRSLCKKYNKRIMDMKTLDHNKDGVIEVLELFTKTYKDFYTFDLNRDRMLDPFEQREALNRFHQVKKDIYGQHIDRRTRKLSKKLKKADEDKDGTITLKEYEQYFGARYQTFDRNKDGIITKKEYRTDVEKLPRSYRRELKR